MPTSKKIITLSEGNESKGFALVFVMIAVVVIAVGAFGFVTLRQSGKNSPESQTGWGQRPGGAEQHEGPGGQKPDGQTGGFQPPQINKNAPLPQLPAGTPKGEWITKKLGDVEIKYFSTAITWGLSENGTDYFITLKNNGKTPATVNSTPVEDLQKQTPQWNRQFFAMQNPPLILKPGEEKKLWYFVSLDEQDKTFTANFKLWLEGNTSSSVDLAVIFGTTKNEFFPQGTTYISGSVKDKDGKPVENVDIGAQMNCGRIFFKGSSDKQGQYALAVLGQEDIKAIYQGRDLSCESTDYFLYGVKEGYKYYFKNYINPTRENPSKVDIVLEKAGSNTSWLDKLTGKKDVGSNYSLAWEKQVADAYGFFWVKPSDDWSVFALAQAKHDPPLNKPTNFYLFDSSGNVVWKQPTGNECWGIDIARDGSKVLAACHDGKVYSVSRKGDLLWTFNAISVLRSVCVSNDGKTAISGGMGKLSLFDTATGSKTDFDWKGSWLRNCKFYPDDSGYIVASREIGGFDKSGKQKWQQVIGEFPMFLGMDSNKNIYASGKSRTLFSFDFSGNLRWKRKIPDHAAGTGANTPDGKKIALGSLSGMIYLFDGNGNILWKRVLTDAERLGGGVSVGHNAVAISQDGTRIVIGSAPGNCVVVFDDNGTLLWKSCIESKETNPDLIKGVTNVQISPDKTKIMATYGDNYVREFILK